MNGTRWTRSNNLPLLWQEWTRDYSVFNPETGETHIISELPVAVLRLLTETPRPLHHIAVQLASDCGVDATAAWEEKVGNILSSLEGLEIIDQLREKMEGSCAPPRLS